MIWLVDQFCVFRWDRFGLNRAGSARVTARTGLHGCAVAKKAGLPVTLPRSSPRSSFREGST